MNTFIAGMELLDPRYLHCALAEAPLNWPGRSRSGRDEETALQVLMGYGLRYAQVLRRLERLCLRWLKQLLPIPMAVRKAERI